MLYSADVPTSPPAASVWPPPPTSTPQTFTVEGITVTKHGGQLFLLNHKAARLSLGGLLSNLVYCIALWLISLSTWASSHHIVGPLSVIWNNPMFRVEAMIKGFDFGLIAFGLTTFALWRRNKARGLTTLNRHTKMIETGKRSGVIKSVVINSIRPFFIPRYFVLLTLHVGSNFALGGSQTKYHFWRKGNAEWVAREIADFLDVPLRNFSAGAGVESIS